MPVQRLLAHAIARQQQPLAPRIPQRERKHAMQPQQRIVAPLLVGMNDHLGVAAGRETVAAAHQFLAQLAKVVDLAVEYQLDRAILIVIGWSPPATSMIASRRIASPRFLPR